MANKKVMQLPKGWEWKKMGVCSHFKSGFGITSK